MNNPIYQDWLRRFREDLRLGDMDQLEQDVSLAGLDTVLDPDFLALARQTDARQVVILIATLGSANAPDPLPYMRLLAAYQCLQGQLSVDDAAAECARSVKGSVQFYRALLASLSHQAPQPDISGIQTRVDDLQFGIELLADANRATAILPLLKAWQRIDRTDMPWLKACRALVCRAKDVRAVTEARQLAQVSEQLLQDAPRGQEPVKQEMRILWANMALKCRDGQLALQAAQAAYAHSAIAERRFTLAKAFMMKGELAPALEHTDALLREMLLDPKAQESADNQAHYSFEVTAAEDTLVTVNRLLRNAGLKPFLMSGTLLGYAREGGLLPHDKDIDIGLIGWEDQFVVAQALIQAGHFVLDLTLLTGQNRFLFSAHDLRNGMAIDFFFFHDKGDHFLHGIDFDLGFTQNFRFSKFDLQEVEFLEDRFYVPSDIDLNLRENYGDWRTPTSSYVVTVESPALCDTPYTRNLLVYLEILKTIAKRMKPQRVVRILDYLDEQEHPVLDADVRLQLRAWCEQQLVQSSMLVEVDA